MLSGPIRGALAAAVLAALAPAACGGGGGDQQAGGSAAEQVTTQTRGITTTTTPADPGGQGGAKKGGRGGGKGKPANPAKSEHAHNGVAIVKSGAHKPSGGAKKPGGGQKPKSAPTTTSALPQQSSKAIFGIARGMCSNPDLLKSVPDGIRGDDDAVATYAEIFAPQGQKQSAHSGCLAGLKSIGR